jgi:phospholipid/cholesterol/gamma-HCH transport system ATP-binding protein
MTTTDAQITVRGLTLAYGSFVVMHDLDFDVRRSAIFFVMGASGSGKSTVMRALIGLQPPVAGTVRYDGEDFLAEDQPHRDVTLRRFGVLYQSGALFSSMTVAENVGLPLTEYTDLSPSEVNEVASLKLALVGLAGFEDFYPGQLSGGMQKRAALARAMALDPQILFLDEPSAGLDPISSRRLDELIVELRDSLGTTVVIVSHELSSIFSIGDSSIYLDTTVRTISASGPPRELLAHPPHERIREFLTRGGSLAAEGGVRG